MSTVPTDKKPAAKRKPRAKRVVRASGEAPAGKRRKDPARRHIDNSSKLHAVGNADPKRKYTSVFTGQAGLIDEYESMGFRVETMRKGGPKYGGRSVKKMGDELECAGHVLMSILKTDHEEIVDNGVDGFTGQNAADDADFLRLKQGMDDPLRGQYRHVGFGGAQFTEES